MMLLALCALIIGFITNLIYRGNDVLTFKIISDISNVFAIIIQVVSLFISKPVTKTSGDVTTLKKLLTSFVVVLTLMLTVVIIVLITRTLYM